MTVPQDRDRETQNQSREIRRRDTGIRTGDTKIHAWRSGDRYEAALFVVADSPAALRSGLAGLIQLGLPRDRNNLAQLLKATNRLAEAEPLMRRAVEIFDTSLGPDHPNSQIARLNWVILLAAMKHEGP
jgi:hypothetical protein